MTSQIYPRRAWMTNLKRLVMGLEPESQYEFVFHDGFDLCRMIKLYDEIENSLGSKPDDPRLNIDLDPDNGLIGVPIGFREEVPKKFFMISVSTIIPSEGCNGAGLRNHQQYESFYGDTSEDLVLSLGECSDEY